MLPVDKELQSWSGAPVILLPLMSLKKTNKTEPWPWLKRSRGKGKTWQRIQKDFTETTAVLKGNAARKQEISFCFRTDGPLDPILNEMKEEALTQLFFPPAFGDLDQLSSWLPLRCLPDISLSSEPYEATKTVWTQPWYKPALGSMHVHIVFYFCRKRDDSVLQGAGLKDYSAEIKNKTLHIHSDWFVWTKFWRQSKVSTCVGIKARHWVSRFSLWWDFLSLLWVWSIWWLGIDTHNQTLSLLLRQRCPPHTYVSVSIQSTISQQYQIRWVYSK